MAERIAALRDRFERLESKRYRYSGLRVLGPRVWRRNVITVVFNFYFSLYFGLKNYRPGDSWGSRVATAFIERTKHRENSSALWWWSGGRLGNSWPLL